MGEVYKPNSEPYTEAELTEILAGLRSLQTYKYEHETGKGGFVPSSELPELLRLMKTEPLPEAIQSYSVFWDKYYNGRIYLEALADALRIAHNNEDAVTFMINSADKDKNGFISEDEFGDILKILEHYNTRLTGLNSTFHNFIVEADTDKDGRVSLEECKVWIQNKLNPGN